MKKETVHTLIISTIIYIILALFVMGDSEWTKSDRMTIVALYLCWIIFSIIIIGLKDLEI